MEEAGALRSSHGEVIPFLQLVEGRDRSGEPWLLVEGSRYGGLPLNGEHGSWYEAWENLQVEVLLQTAHGLLPIDDWSQVADVVRGT